MLRTQLAVLRRFLKRDPADTIAMLNEPAAEGATNDSVAAMPLGPVGPASPRGAPARRARITLGLICLVLVIRKWCAAAAVPPSATNSANPARMTAGDGLRMRIGDAPVERQKQ